MNNSEDTVHVVSVISETGRISSRVFEDFNLAMDYYEYQSNLPQDNYSNGRRQVYLEVNIVIE